MIDSKLPFRIEETGSVTRMVLPVRRLGEARRFAWIGIGVGCFMLLFMAVWIGTPLSWGIDLLRQGEWFGLLFVGFSMLGLFGLRTAGFIFAGSVAVLRDTTQGVVEIRNGKLYGNEKFGWVTWRRKIKIDQITKLTVGASMGTRNEEKATSDMFPALRNLESLVAHKRAGKFPVANAYPREILLPLANELIERLGRVKTGIEWSAPADFSTPDFVKEDVETKPKIELEVLEKGETASVSQPAGSTIIMQERDDSTAFEIPPSGVWRGTRGLMFFALVWNGFMVIVTCAALFGEMEADADGSIVMVWLFLGLFWSVGIGLAIAAINMGTRSVMIGVLGDMLFIERKSIFGKRWTQFLHSELDTIEVGHSGMEVNDRPINELQIHPRTSKKVGLLSQREDDELRWLASELRSLLELRSVEGTGENWRSRLDEKGNPIELASGAIKISERVGGKEIVVPSIGIGKNIGAAIASLAFMVIGPGVLIFPAIAALWKGDDDGIRVFNLIGAVVPGLFGIAFFLMGACIFTIWIVMATRRFRIHASPETLTINRFGVLSTKRFHWDADQIESIDRRKSSLKVNNQRQDELRIDVNGDAGLTFLTGRPRDEIDFVAGHINQTLDR